MRQINLVIAISFFIFVLFSVFALGIIIQNREIAELEDCKDLEYLSVKNLPEECIDTREVIICDDEANTSCHTEKIEIRQECTKETRTEVVTKRECMQIGYEIDDSLMIDTTSYKCMQETKESSQSILCDSIYDGNGDGICTSGESCIKYVFEEGLYKKYEKNSEEDFLDQDNSFFIESRDIEVLK
jgi:hypothetical protein